MKQQSNRMDLDDNSLKILSCDMSVGPSNAAGIEDLVPFVRGKTVVGDAVAIEFDESGKTVVESFIAAEQMCCTGLTWELSKAGTNLKLTIAGTAEQIAVIEEWFE